MAEIQIQPKSAKRTKGLGRPDTVREPSSVRIMKAAVAAVGTPWLRILNLRASRRPHANPQFSGLASSSASLIAHMGGDRGNAAELGHLKGEAAIW
jgi:hypothetical protein